MQEVVPVNGEHNPVQGNGVLLNMAYRPAAPLASESYHPMAPPQDAAHYPGPSGSNKLIHSNGILLQCSFPNRMQVLNSRTPTKSLLSHNTLQHIPRSNILSFNNQGRRLKTKARISVIRGFLQACQMMVTNTIIKTRRDLM